MAFCGGMQRLVALVRKEQQLLFLVPVSLICIMGAAGTGAAIEHRLYTVWESNFKSPDIKL